jgi:hypothetical protein
MCMPACRVHACVRVRATWLLTIAPQCRPAAAAACFVRSYPSVGRCRAVPVLPMACIRNTLHIRSILRKRHSGAIGCLVLDSPFASLTQVCLVVPRELHACVPLSVPCEYPVSTPPRRSQVARELAARETQGTVPDVAVQTLLTMIKGSVKAKAGFSMDDVKPLDSVGRCFLPALFGYAEGDGFVSPLHCRQLYESYAGDKNLQSFEGDHNSHRPPSWSDKVAAFLHQALGLGAAQLGLGAENIEELSVRELKARLRARGLSYTDCLEKKDLVRRFRESLEGDGTMNVSRGPSLATLRQSSSLLGQSVI